MYGKTSSVPEKKIANAVLEWFCQGAVRHQCVGGAVCFDGPDIFRFRVYGGYKSTRREKKEQSILDNAAQGLPAEDTAGAFIAPTIELLKEHGIVTEQKDDYEADDLLMSASRFVTKLKPRAHVWLEARDKDLFQAVNDRVSVWTPAMGLEKEVIWTPKSVLAKKGMTPKQFLRYQILHGDATDDVPPIPEIGSPKKAKSIAIQYDKLTDFFMTEEGGKLFDKYVSELHRNRQLVSMVRDAWTIKDLDFKLKGVNSRAPAFAALKSNLSKKSLF